MFTVFRFGLFNHQAGCPVLAALLHYVLLALFSWMLCEGVLHYILIVKVFGGGSGTKVRYFCLFAWGRFFSLLLWIIFSKLIGVSKQGSLGFWDSTLWIPDYLKHVKAWPEANLHN